jgi:hypothetical protein
MKDEGSGEKERFLLIALADGYPSIIITRESPSLPIARHPYFGVIAVTDEDRA